MYEDTIRIFYQNGSKEDIKIKYSGANDRDRALLEAYTEYLDFGMAIERTQVISSSPVEHD